MLDVAIPASSRRRRTERLTMTFYPPRAIPSGELALAGHAEPAVAHDGNELNVQQSVLEKGQLRQLLARLIHAVCLAHQHRAAAVRHGIDLAQSSLGNESECGLDLIH